MLVPSAFANCLEASASPLGQKLRELVKLKLGTRKNIVDGAVL